MKPYAIQNKAIGYMQWVGKARSAEDAFGKFKDQIDDDLDIAAHDIYLLSEEQFQTLKDCDGTDQEAIDYLESCK